MTKLTPFVPSRRDPWDARKARHLLNRAGFGPTLEEVDAYVRMGFDDAVDRIIHYDKIPDPLAPPAWLNQPLDLPELPAGVGLGRPKNPPEANPPGAAPPNPVPGAANQAAPDQEQLRRLRQTLMRANRLRIEELRAWWVDRMVRTPRPLEEKMTLFWHGHFATQAIKVKIPQAVYLNNELLRRNATGSFRDLVLDVSRDPAMIIYLDSNQNRREHPNENYARELMELFTLGIGHYTEDDVKEAARAFTGWSLGIEGAGGMRPGAGRLLLRLAANQARPAFRFRPAWHDNGEKQFLGRRGSFDGSDIVRIILEQPACAEFVCAKLVRYFVGEDRPEPELVAGLVEVMRRSDYQIKPVLDTLFRSQAFYAGDVIGGQIKSPLQLVAGAVKQLHAAVDPPEALTRALLQMGQIPFDPPNVAGWHGGRQWINTSTLLARYNFSLFLLEGHAPGLAPARAPAQGLRLGPFGRQVETKVDVMALCSPEELKSPERLVDRLSEHFLSLPLAPAQRSELVAAAQQSALDDEARLKQLVHLVMSTPNYQVC
jgi:uncharacterized protein (DUF1800 family)